MFLIMLNLCTSSLPDGEKKTPLAPSAPEKVFVFPKLILKTVHVVNSCCYLFYKLISYRKPTQFPLMDQIACIQTSTSAQGFHLLPIPKDGIPLGFKCTS